VKRVEQLCRRTRRQWVLEHSLRGVAWTAGWAVNACLLWLVLDRLVDLPWTSLVAVPALAAATAGAVLLGAWIRAPRGSRLAQLVDDRARTRDLFASALEFQRDPPRFGWLGQLTCQKAQAEASRVSVAGQWSLGPARPWAATAAAGVLLGVSLGAVVAWERMRSPPGPEIIAKRDVRQPQPSINGAASEEKPAVGEPVPKEKPETALPGEVEEAATEKPAETVKITNEMLDRYLQQVPEEEKVSLEGITPIRWDEDEATGKANPQNQRKEGEKVDPVKLDASLLKDLEAAKKTKEEGGKEGGAVDVVVMGQDRGESAKGKSGGKEGKESLADAASKDPRGNPTRLAVTPARKGLQITSAARGTTSEKGQVRPMGLLEFLTAMRRAELTPESPDRGAAAAAGRAPEEVIPSETVPDSSATSIEAYFRRLREADR